MAELRDRYGPVAVVTGASSGIGWAFAEELAKRGFDLVLVARRVDRLEDLARQLTAANGIAVAALPVDLGRADAAQIILDATTSHDVGLVVSNAGFGMKGDHADNDPAAMTEMLMVNCNVPMQLARGFAPRLRARGSGGLILVSSVEGLIGCPYSTAYSASKALVNALGEGLWAELKPDGVDVLTVCPGATESEAAGKQGIDLAKLRNVMPARDVARASLDNLAEGPTFFPSEIYKATFDQLLAMPRCDALMAMAKGIKGNS
ncbi:MAG: SDR family NAD(P)-dependent oxidoreductase [Novosphingobium sp.]